MSDRFDEMAREIAGACDHAPWGNLKPVKCSPDQIGTNNVCETCAVAFPIAAALRRVAMEENEACETVARNFVDHDAPRARHVIGERIAARRKGVEK